MQFGSPLFFWAFLLLPVLTGFFIWAYQRKQAALARFGDMALIKKLTPDSGINRQIIKWVLFLSFYFFICTALVRPQFGVKMETMERKGVDIIVALDISKSMLAEDVTPNRLDRAKHEIQKFIDLLKGDRIGLIVFAGESYVQCPLTLDYGAAKMYLDVVNTNWIQMQGTSLGDAIRQSTKAFRSEAKKYKVLVIISDGEDHEGDAVVAAKEASKEGVKIYTVGIGSEGGVPIPVDKGSGNIVYKKDSSENLVMTRLNPAILDDISQAGNGRYFHAGTNLDLSLIYSEIAKMEKKELGMNRLAVYEEQYQLFLLIAMILLFIEFFIPERIKRKQEWRGRFE